MTKTTEKVILAIILFVGACLRIYNYWDFSLSNDELSALSRLNFDSFSDLIHKGVKIDGHPAAAQVLLYYTVRLFGDSVAVVRFPFVVAGTIAIYYVYRLGKEWISTSTGLLSAATFATLIFPLLYTRIARPYSLGMLFTLMASFYWIRIIKNNHSKQDFFWLAISFTLCAYTHYFSGLVAFILTIAGGFLIKKSAIKWYLLALFGAFLLYLPHIPIFFYQLNVGGVGGWLGPPESDWLWQHIRYVFNESWLAFAAITSIGALGVFNSKSKWEWKNTLLPLILFLLPFVIGFYYSRSINPVLQNSTLLFSFPFLLVFVFSKWDDSKVRQTKIVSISLLAILFFSSVVEKQFYTTDYFGQFKKLATDIVEWDNEIENNALLVGDFHHAEYIDYYLSSRNNIALDLYTIGDRGLLELKTLLKNSTEEYLIYAWSTKHQFEETECIIKEFFPEKVRGNKYFNSESIMFKRGPTPIYSEKFNFENNDKWNFVTSATMVDSLQKKGVVISTDSPYGPTFTVSVSELESKGFNEIVVYVECQISDNETSLQMAYEQTNQNGGYLWESDMFNRQFDKDRCNWGVFHYEIQPSGGETDVLKVYPWLPDGNSATINRMEIRYR